MRLRKHHIVAICMTLILWVSAGVVIGCGQRGDGAQTGQQPSSASRQDGADAGTTRDYAEAYPLQYAGLQQARVNSNGVTVGHSAERVGDTCEAPTIRDRNGDPVPDENGNVQMIPESYDAASGTYDIDLLDDEVLVDMNLMSGCVSCKSTRFEKLYDEQGAAAFTSPYNASARAIVDGDYFDCAMCHEGDPGKASMRPGLMYFQVLGAGLADRLDERNAVCAQCHNSYDYRSSIKTEDDLRTMKAYRNGYDVDALFETCWEDGVNFELDEETGLVKSCLVHPTIELFMDTKMQLLGVTCADCHMPKALSDDGEEYTDHFAANSPIENENALSYCLNCHEQMGISSTERMAAFVRDRESQMAAGIETLQERRAAFGEKLEQALNRQSGSDAEVADWADAAKKLYAKVTWYECCLLTGPAELPGSQVAMMDWRGILDKANSVCDEGVALLG